MNKETDRLYCHFTTFCPMKFLDYDLFYLIHSVYRVLDSDLLYSVLFYSVLFCSILFYSVLSVLFCSTVFLLFRL